MTFAELMEYCRSEALANRVVPTNESIYRQFCRSYSKKFNTPLAEVEAMEPLDVVRHVYEDNYESFDLEERTEDALEELYSLSDPEYAAQKKDQLDEFMERALVEEEQRLAEDRPIHKAIRQEVTLPKGTSVKAPPTEKKLPQSGGINLAYLENEDIEGFHGDFE